MRTLYDIIKNGANDRQDTIVLSDFFLLLNCQQYPLRFISKIINTFIPEYSSEINECFEKISKSNIKPKHYKNMSLTAKQVVCAIYIANRINIGKLNLYLFILAIVGRHCYPEYNIIDDYSLELSATNNFIKNYIPPQLTEENIGFISNVSANIHPNKRNNRHNVLTRNISDAILMPTFGISWELFYNDIIKIEREKMIKMDSFQCLLFLNEYFKDGWLGVLKDSPFSKFPNRLINQFTSK